jgi:iron complex outermembrane receptor protein
MSLGFRARRAPVRRVVSLSSLVLIAFLLPKNAPRCEELAANGVIAGRALASTGAPVPDAKVSLVELHRRANTGADGGFRFDDVPAGTYLLEIVSSQFGSAVATVPVTAGNTAQITIRLDLTVHHEDVVVSASPYARGASSVAQPVTVLDGIDLQAAVQPTLGETLQREPGVTGTSYSPGVSRPVIRGQGGDRIRVLEDGIGVGDASNVSEDHAVAYDPLTAERVEVVRGPATLLYGSNATGGIVNVIDDRIPSERTEKALGGSFEARYGSNADEGAGAFDLNGGAGAFGWHLDGLKRETSDFKSGDGTLANSDIDSKHGTAGASFIGKDGYLGASWGRFETNYGIPTDEKVRIDMHQDRADVHGEITKPVGIFQGIRLRAGKTSYDHAEIEDTGAIGTQFFNDSWETRVEAAHRQMGRFHGAFGLQYASRDFKAVGDEAFVPPTTTHNAGIFGFEEIAAGKVSFEIGARYEHQNNTADDPILPDRSFNGVSGSGAVVWRMPKDYRLALTVSRSERLPTAEELYANGPHLATFEFQVGDPALSSEVGLSYDLTFRRTKGAVSGSASLFYNDYNGFIFLQPTGNLIDVDGEPVPEFQYIQVDSTFRGAEAHLDIDLVHADPHHVSLELSGDTVRAEQTDIHEPLPRITPTRYGLGVRYRGPHLWGLVEARRTDDQNRVAPNETPTDGFTWFNASIGYRFVTAGLVHDLLLRGMNLTDEQSFNHVSPLKDVVPLPGRDIAFSYRLTF